MSTPKKKRIFISQPMSGHTKQEVLERRQQIIEKLNVNPKYYSIINNVTSEAFDAAHNNNIWLLGHALQYLSKADLIVFSDGWHSSRGCNIEFKTAETYKIKMLFEHEINDGIRNKFKAGTY